MHAVKMYDLASYIHIHKYITVIMYAANYVAVLAIAS